VNLLRYHVRISEDTSADYSAHHDHRRVEEIESTGKMSFG